MSKVNQRFVLSLGGSLIVPDTLDTVFLEAFKSSILALLEDGYSFIIIPGGGATARRYQTALMELGITEPSVRDRVGMRACLLNAELLLTLFKDQAHPELILENAQVAEITHPLIIAVGTEAGRSSDAGSVELAVASGVHTVVNLSNIAHVYARDPRLNPEAESYREISWVDYRALIPADWDPGLSTPFDPVASKMAEESGLTVAILDGHDIQAFERFVREGICEGTLIGSNGKT